MSTDSAITAALNAADAQVRAMIALMRFCGLRAAEVAALRGSDLPTAPGWLLTVTAGKRGHDRSVPAPADVIDAMRGLGTGPDLVFRGQDGEPYSGSQVNAKVGTHLRRFGIEGSAHQLRGAYLAAVAARGGAA